MGQFRHLRNTRGRTEFPQPETPPRILEPLNLQEYKALTMKLFGELIPPIKVVSAIAGMLEAEDEVCSTSGEVISRRPNWQARGKAVEFALHYTQGKPVDRVMMAHVGQERAEEDPEAELRNSIGYRRAVEREARKLGIAVVPAIETEAEACQQTAGLLSPEANPLNTNDPISTDTTNDTNE